MQIKVFNFMDHGPVIVDSSTFHATKTFQCISDHMPTQTSRDLDMSYKCEL